MLYASENPHGGDIYGGEIRLDFSANINPYGTPEGVLQAAAESLGSIRCYPDPYCRALVKALSDFEGLPEDYILCGSGAAELIYSYCEALRPRRALLPAPSFAEYELGLRQTGCEICRWALPAERDFEPDEGILEALRRERPSVLFLCNPNNPSGRLLPPALLREILRLCGELSCALFLDECFLDLADGGESLRGELAAHPELFILKAFTKSYGMAGLRLGCGLSSSAPLLRAMSRTVQPWNVSVPAQAAGIAALREQDFVEKARALIRRERPRLRAGLAGLGFHVCPSAVNFLLFRGPAGLDRALRRRGIAIRNCDNYPGLGPGWYRCAVKLPEENDELLRNLAAIMERNEVWQGTL